MQPSDNMLGCLVTSHINVARCFFQNNRQNWWRTDILGDCTYHRALYARGLVHQCASLETWGLHRPPSTIRSGTGRPVCQFGDLGAAPTTEHCMPGNWSTSLPFWRLGDCTNQFEHYTLGNWSTSPQFENSGTVPTTEHYMLGDWSISLYDCKRA